MEEKKSDYLKIKYKEYNIYINGQMLCVSCNRHKSSK